MKCSLYDTKHLFFNETQNIICRIKNYDSNPKYLLTMKTTAILVFVCLLSYSSFANNPEIELKEIVTAPELDFSTAFEELFENKARLNNASIVEERKIIIIDSDFKKIREESIEKTEDIFDQSTLVPIIYRSQFITKVHNVSYYMLQKK